MNINTKSRGVFVTVEGPDGGGKTTQIKRLTKWLESTGKTVCRTREPGGSPGAEEIRALILQGDTDRWSPETELLLFKAARRDHLERTILPALERGEIVISDRFADSTRAYQGTGRANLRATVDQLHELMIGIEPDLTIIIDIDPDYAFRRMAGRNHTDSVAAAEDRFECFGIELQNQLRQAYLDIAKEEAHQSRCVVIDGHGTEDEVFERIRATIKERLQVIEE